MAISVRAAGAGRERRRGHGRALAGEGRRPRRARPAARRGDDRQGRRRDSCARGRRDRGDPGGRGRDGPGRRRARARSRQARAPQRRAAHRRRRLRAYRARPPRRRRRARMPRARDAGGERAGRGDAASISRSVAGHRRRRPRDEGRRRARVARAEAAPAAALAAPRAAPAQPRRARRARRSDAAGEAALRLLRDPGGRPRHPDDAAAQARRRAHGATRSARARTSAPWPRSTCGGVVRGCATRTRRPSRRRTASALTFLPFIVHAAVRALREFPRLNASVLEDAIVEKRDIHIGIAVETEKGLVVPVVRHADRLSLAGPRGGDRRSLDPRAHARSSRPTSSRAAPSRSRTPAATGTCTASRSSTSRRSASCAWARS